jgi:uncharacterized protein YndB with AHSA1/START domain
MEIKYTLAINAPVEKVFNLVDDDEKLKLWMEGLEETVYTSEVDREKPVGTKFRQKIREGGRLVAYEGEVTAYDKPHHLGVRIGNKQFSMQVDYRFSSIETGTRLDYSAAMIEATWFARLVGKLFSGLTKRILNKQMAALKTLAEQTK